MSVLKTTHSCFFFAINTTQFLATEFCYRMGMGQVSSVESLREQTERLKFDYFLNLNSNEQ